jgi:hypothetical protein
MVQTQGKIGNTFQESNIGKEGLDMKPQTGQARVRISEVLGTSIGARFIRVVALGALLVGAAALYSSMSQGEAGSLRSGVPGIFEETVLPGRYQETGVTKAEGEIGIFEETVLPGRYREGAVTKAEGEIGIFEETVLPGRYREGASYEQQRAADSLQERLEVLRLQQDMLEQ